MKSKRYISALALVLCICALACACTKKYDFSMDGGAYVDHRLNISYTAAPSCYEPIKMDTEIYGEMDKVKFFRIIGADPEKWLCEELGNVFYADGVKLPTLGEMTLTYVDLFDSEQLDADLLDDEEPLERVTDADVIGTIVDAYCNGENVSRPVWTQSSFDVNWRIKLADESIGIYYVLTYVELKENYVEIANDGTQIDHGKKFLYNRFESRLVPVDGILDEYVERYGTSVEVTE